MNLYTFRKQAEMEEVKTKVALKGMSVGPYFLTAF